MMRCRFYTPTGKQITRSLHDEVKILHTNRETNYWEGCMMRCMFYTPNGETNYWEACMVRCRFHTPTGKQIAGRLA